MIKSLFLMLLNVYQGIFHPIRVLLGLNGCCRHIPTCSNYAKEALQKHGVRSGGLLILKRIFRCHPWGTSGFDPVPQTISSEHIFDKKADLK